MKEFVDYYIARDTYDVRLLGECGSVCGSVGCTMISLDSNSFSLGT
jgi:hypothetical protein